MPRARHHAMNDILDTVVGMSPKWVTIHQIVKDTGRGHSSVRGTIARAIERELVQSRTITTAAGRQATQVSSTVRAEAWMWAYKRDIPTLNIVRIMETLGVLRGYNHPLNWEPEIEETGHMWWGGRNNGLGEKYVYPIKFLAAYLGQYHNMVRRDLTTLLKHGYVERLAPARMSGSLSDRWSPGGWDEPNAEGWAITPEGEKLYGEWQLDIGLTGLDCERL